MYSAIYNAGMTTAVHRVLAIGRRTALGLMATALVPQRLAAQTRDVLVFAAASLKDALDEIAAQVRRATGKRVAISHAASSALARQIEAGAPADLIVSADRDWMDYLAQRNLIRAGTRSDLLGNRLVLIAPAGSAADVAIAPGFPLARLLGDGRLAMANTAAVPAGRYGKAALEALGVWPSVAGRLAQAENVRVALLLVARGEAPLGIVYRTDAAADPSVRVAGVFPEGTHPPIIYPVALTTASANPDAVALLAYLRSADARTAFERQGFAVLAPPAPRPQN
jgi:molybdate transport system substrate-binding protein